MNDTLNINNPAEILAQTFPTTENGIARVLNLSNSSVVAAIFIGAFLLLAFAVKSSKYIYIQQIKDISGSTKFSQKFNFLLKETSVSAMLTWMLALLGFSLFFVLSYVFFNSQNAAFAHYEMSSFLLSFFAKTGITLSAAALFFYLSYRLLILVSRIFSFDRSIVYMILNFSFLIIKMLGILLLIISFFFIYMPVLWQPLCICLGFLLVFGAFCLLAAYHIRNFFAEGTSLFYFFLYFCTLEILPVLVIRKLLIGLYKLV
jgi:hypothetical protein